MLRVSLTVGDIFLGNYPTLINMAILKFISFDPKVWMDLKLVSMTALDIDPIFIIDLI